MIKLNKEEYDYLKFIEHEYTNLFDDVALAPPFPNARL